MAALGFALVAGGCSQQRRWHKHPALLTEGDVVKCLGKALEHELPDERREAINRIARSRHVGHQVVLETFDIIARTDPSPAVRCAALLALRRSGRPLALATYAAVLNPGNTAEEVRPTTPEVRRDALHGVIALMDGGESAAEHERDLRETTVQLIAQDRSSDIRVASARLLGYFAYRSVLEPLISALDQRDFGVVYEAERSLIRLTGQTFDHDSVQWRRWLAQTSDPFADAGKLDHLLEPQQNGWWRRSVDSVRHTIGSFRLKKEDS